MVKKIIKEIEKDNSNLLNKKTIGAFFLGIGIIMLLMNIMTYLVVMPYTTMLENLGINLLMSGYYVSIGSSILLILYSLYNIYEGL